MRVIAIVGKVDKRPLVYAAARALGVGKFVGIITDDSAFRRLYQEDLNGGTTGRVNIVVTLKPSEKSMEKLAVFGVEHDVVMYVTDSFIPANAEYVVKCESKDTSMNMADDAWEEHIQSIKDGSYKAEERKPDLHIVVSPDQAPKGFEAIWMNISWDMMYYCMACEQNRGLIPYSAKDKKPLQAVCQVMAKALDMAESEMETLMTREDYITKED